MIEQYVFYAGSRRPKEAVVQKVRDFPGIVIREEGYSDTYVLRFEAEDVLTREDFKLDSDWYVMKSARHMLR